MTTEVLSPARAGRAAFHPLSVARVERLCDDAAAVTFDVPAEPGRGLRLPARAVADPASRRRRRRAAPLVLDLRAGRCRPAGRRARRPGRRVLDLARRRRAPRRRGRGAAPERFVRRRPAGWAGGTCWSPPARASRR
nr:hypothetical protein [Angustibacter aerolatus]